MNEAKIKQAIEELVGYAERTSNLEALLKNYMEEHSLYSCNVVLCEEKLGEITRYWFEPRKKHNRKK